MKVLVVGCRGLVGMALCPALAQLRHEVRGVDLPEEDVTRADSFRVTPGGWTPDWVVNLAARTDVDGCESDREGAFAVNAKGAETVARAALEAGARLAHLSTDYVFDGAKGAPYREEDDRRPLSVYARSKSEGEDLVRAVLPPERLLLVRAQSLYGKGGKSFPDAVLAAAKAKGRVPVVTDQVVQPTWVRDLVRALTDLMVLGGKGASGTYHFAASGRCTWNEFARAVLETAGLKGARIAETTSAALGRPAPRPPWSVFDTGKFERATGIRPRPWREQLRDYLRSAGRAP